MSKPKRENGFYYIRRKRSTDWEPAEYVDDPKFPSGFWWNLGSMVRRCDNDFYKIDEQRLEPPTKK